MHGICPSLRRISEVCLLFYAVHYDRRESSIKTTTDFTDCADRKVKSGGVI